MMNSMRCFWLRSLPAILAGVLGVSAVSADVKVANIFSDHMVLQRDVQVPVWGWAEPGEAVTVSFGGQTRKTKADAKGEWEVRLLPLSVCKEGRTLLVRGKNKVEFKDVVVGDVWLASGQSNMGWTLGHVAKQLDLDLSFMAAYPLIRHVGDGRNVAAQPQDDSRYWPWRVCEAKHAGKFTAAGYYFALALHKKLGIPIGILNSSTGGSNIESYIPREAYESTPNLEAYVKVLREYDPASGMDDPVYKKAGRPASKYNARIAPITRFPVKGMIWYQGEAACVHGDKEIYFWKQKALIEGWRKAFGRDFPFYLVQLAGFSTPQKKPGQGKWAVAGFPIVREMQLRAAREIPKCGMAVAIDCGEEKEIHFRNKKDVGERLALWALAKDYGQKKLVYSGPLWKKATVEGDTIRVSFTHTGGGLMVGKKDGLKPAVEDKGGKLASFAIAETDGKFVWADAVIDGNTVVVSSPAVRRPAFVRYAWHRNPAGPPNLYNREGLPASPFRTDTLYPGMDWK